MSDVERATVEWQGGLAFQGDVRGLEVRADKPKAKGGTDTGPMPSEVYLVALAACTMMSTVRVAETRKVAVDGMRAEAELAFTDEGRPGSVSMTFHVDSPAGPEAWRTVARLADKFCTVEQLTSIPIAKRYVVNGDEDAAIEVDKAE